MHKTHICVHCKARVKMTRKFRRLVKVDPANNTYFTECDEHEGMPLPNSLTAPSVLVR